MNFMP